MAGSKVPLGSARTARAAAVETLPPYDRLPSYWQRKAWVAAASRLVVRLAEPPVTATEPSTAAPSKKVAWPALGAGEICAVNVTGWPNPAGFGVTDNVVEVCAGAIAKPQLPVAMPAGAPVESAAWVVKEKLPDMLGVPAMAPLELFKVSPGGSDPAVMEKV